MTTSGDFQHQAHHLLAGKPDPHDSSREFKTDLRSYRSALGGGADWSLALDASLGVGGGDAVWVPPGIWPTDRAWVPPAKKTILGPGAVQGTPDVGAVVQCTAGFSDTLSDAWTADGVHVLLQTNSGCQVDGVMFDGNSKPDVVTYVRGVAANLKRGASLNPNATGAALKVGRGLSGLLPGDSAPSGSQLFIHDWMTAAGNAAKSCWIAPQAQDVQMIAPFLISGGIIPWLVESGGGAYTKIRVAGSNAATPSLAKLTGNDNEIIQPMFDSGYADGLLISGGYDNRILGLKGHGTGLDFSHNLIVIDGAVSSPGNTLEMTTGNPVGPNPKGIGTLSDEGVGTHRAKLTLTSVADALTTPNISGSAQGYTLLVRKGASGGVNDLITPLAVVSGAPTVWILVALASAADLAAGKEFVFRGWNDMLHFGSGSFQTDNALRTRLFSGDATHCINAWNVRPGVVGTISQYTHMVP